MPPGPASPKARAPTPGRRHSELRGVHCKGWHWRLDAASGACLLTEESLALYWPGPPSPRPGAATAARAALSPRVTPPAPRSTASRCQQTPSPRHVPTTAASAPLWRGLASLASASSPSRCSTPRVRPHTSESVMFGGVHSGIRYSPEPDAGMSAAAAKLRACLASPSAFGRSGRGGRRARAPGLRAEQPPRPGGEEKEQGKEEAAAASWAPSLPSDSPAPPQHSGEGDPASPSRRGTQRRTTWTPGGEQAVKDLAAEIKNVDTADLEEARPEEKGPTLLARRQQRQHTVSPLGEAFTDLSAELEMGGSSDLEEASASSPSRRAKLTTQRTLSKRSSARQELPAMASLSPSPSGSRLPSPSASRSNSKNTSGAWHEAAELPPIDSGTLWEAMTIQDGRPNSLLMVNDILGYYVMSRMSGLTKELAEALVLCPREPTDGPLSASISARSSMSSSPATEIRDLLPGQAAQLCSLILGAEEGEEGTPQALWLLCSCVGMDCEDDRDLDWSLYGISRTDSMNFKQFKKLISTMACIIGVEEAVFLCAMSWVAQHQFEMPEALGRELVEKATKKPCSGPPRITQADYFRMLYLVDAIDAHGRHGVNYMTASGMFAKVLRRLPVLFAERRDRRKGLRPSKDPATPRAAEAEESRERRDAVVGWTHFGILMQAVYEAMPKGMYGGPLHMCHEFLKRARAVDAQPSRGRSFLDRAELPVARTTSTRSEPAVARTNSGRRLQQQRTMPSRQPPPGEDRPALRKQRTQARSPTSSGQSLRSAWLRELQSQAPSEDSRQASRAASAQASEAGEAEEARAGSPEGGWQSLGDMEADSPGASEASGRPHGWRIELPGPEEPEVEEGARPQRLRARVVSPE